MITEQKSKFGQGRRRQCAAPFSKTNSPQSQLVPSSPTHSRSDASNHHRDAGNNYNADHKQMAANTEDINQRAKQSSRRYRDQSCRSNSNQLACTSSPQPSTLSKRPTTAAPFAGDHIGCSGKKPRHDSAMLRGSCPKNRATIILSQGSNSNDVDKSDYCHSHPLSELTNHFPSSVSPYIPLTSTESPNLSSLSFSTSSSPVDSSSSNGCPTHNHYVNYCPCQSSSSVQQSNYNTSNYRSMDVEKTDPNRAKSAEFISVNSTVVDNLATHPHQIVALVEVRISESTFSESHKLTLYGCDFRHHLPSCAVVLSLQPSNSRLVEVDVEVMATRLAEVAACSLDDARGALRSCNFHVDEALLLLMEANRQSIGMNANLRVKALYRGSSRVKYPRSIMSPVLVSVSFLVLFFVFFSLIRHLLLLLFRDLSCRRYTFWVFTGQWSKHSYR